MRLDKLLAHTGFGTRKQVKKIIRDGYISVNGKVETKSGRKIDPENDDVRVGAERIFYEEFVYFMLNKPAGVISATEDLYHDTVLDLLEPGDIVQDPHPVGRLDIDTEGLLILTNDGQLTHQLTSPKKNIDKEYYAVVKGLVDESDIKSFKEGLLIEDKDESFQTKLAELEIIDKDEEEKTSEVSVVIREGKFHQVKRMFKAVGKEVIYLKRVRMGSLYLDKALPLGEYRVLSESELNQLKNNKDR